MGIDDALTSLAELSPQEIRCRLEQLSKEQRLLRFLLRAKRMAPDKDNQNTLDEIRCEGVDDIHRWCQHGVRGIRLDSCLIGGRRFTSAAALARFQKAVTKAAGHDQKVADQGELHEAEKLVAQTTLPLDSSQ